MQPQDNTPPSIEPAATPNMAAAQTEDPNKVWISREEYEALRSRAAEPAATMVPSGAVPAAVASAAPYKRKDSPLEIGVGVAIATLLYLSVTVDALGWMLIPAIGGLLAFAAIYFMHAEKDKAAAAAQQRAAGVAPAPRSGASTALSFLGGFVILLLLAPLIGIFGLWILFMLMTAGSGGRGS